MFVSEMFAWYQNQMTIIPVDQQNIKKIGLRMRGWYSVYLNFVYTWCLHMALCFMNS